MRCVNSPRTPLLLLFRLKVVILVLATFTTLALRINANGDYEYLFDGHASPFVINSEVRVVLVGGFGEELADDLGNVLEAAFSSHQPSCLQSVDADGAQQGPRPLHLIHQLHYGIEVHGAGCDVAQSIHEAVRAGVVNGTISTDVVEKQLETLVVGPSRTIFVLDTGVQDFEYSYTIPGTRVELAGTQRWISRRGYVVLDLRACSGIGGNQDPAAFSSSSTTAFRSSAHRCNAKHKRLQPRVRAMVPVDEIIQSQRAPNLEKAWSKTDGQISHAFVGSVAAEVVSAVQHILLPDLATCGEVNLDAASSWKQSANLPSIMLFVSPTILPIGGGEKVSDTHARSLQTEIMDTLRSDFKNVGIGVNVARGGDLDLIEVSTAMRLSFSKARAAMNWPKLLSSLLEKAPRPGHGDQGGAHVPVFVIALPKDGNIALDVLEGGIHFAGDSAGVVAITLGGSSICRLTRALLGHFLSGGVPVSTGIGAMHDPSIRYLPGRGQIIQDMSWARGWHIYDELDKYSSVRTEEGQDLHGCGYQYVLRNRGGSFHNMLVRNALLATVDAALLAARRATKKAVSFASLHAFDAASLAGNILLLKHHRDNRGSGTNAPQETFNGATRFARLVTIINAGYVALPGASDLQLKQHGNAEQIPAAFAEVGDALFHLNSHIELLGAQFYRLSRRLRDTSEEFGASDLEEAGSVLRSARSLEEEVNAVVSQAEASLAPLSSGDHGCKIVWQRSDSHRGSSTWRYASFVAAMVVLGSGLGWGFSIIN